MPGSSFVATDGTNIPTGLQSVAGTPFDFRSPTAVGSRINQNHPQLKVGKGYDHTWVVPHRDKLGLAAVLQDPESGRQLKLFTNQPGVQFYSGNYLDGSLRGSNGSLYPLRSGLCLEPQVFPDSPITRMKKGGKAVCCAPGELSSFIYL